MDKIFLDEYTLQSDSRIRLPKSAIANINAVPGESRFMIYFDVENNSIVLQMKAVAPEEENNSYPVKGGTQNGQLSR